MKIWKVILAVLVIYTAGVTTGALVTRLSTRTNPQPAIATATAPDGTALPMWIQQRIQMMRRMETQLDLTQEQHERIEKLLGESQDRLKEIWDPITPKVREESRLLRQRIEAELTREQKRKFDTLFKTRRANEQRTREDRRRGEKNQTNSGPSGKENRLE